MWGIRLLVREQIKPMKKLDVEIIFNGKRVDIVRVAYGVF